MIGKDVKDWPRRGKQINHRDSKLTTAKIPNQRRTAKKTMPSRCPKRDFP
jgi:hypothetical protein